jgi:hypothetical protein
MIGGVWRWSMDAGVVHELHTEYSGSWNGYTPCMHISINHLSSQVDCRLVRASPCLYYLANVTLLPSTWGRSVTGLKVRGGERGDSDISKALLGTAAHKADPDKRQGGLDRKRPLVRPAFVVQYECWLLHEWIMAAPER